MFKFEFLLSSTLCYSLAETQFPSAEFFSFRKRNFWVSVPRIRPFNYKLAETTRKRKLKSFPWLNRQMFQHLAALSPSTVRHVIKNENVSAPSGAFTFSFFIIRYSLLLFYLKNKKTRSKRTTKTQK